jgi:hypothetical protein
MEIYWTVMYGTVEVVLPSESSSERLLRPALPEIQPKVHQLSFEYSCINHSNRQSM